MISTASAASQATKPACSSCPLLRLQASLSPKPAHAPSPHPQAPLTASKHFAPSRSPSPKSNDVVEKTNGCLVWGGSLELAPADDLFIQVEYPLGIDPMLLPSILSKKKAIGATHVVIDIPTGMGAKIKTRTEAYTLASDFVDLGKRLGLKHPVCPHLRGSTIGMRHRTRAGSPRSSSDADGRRST